MNRGLKFLIASLKLKHLNGGFVHYKQAAFHTMLTDRLSCGLFVDFCDVLISCLDLTAPIHCEQVM